MKPTLSTLALLLLCAVASLHAQQPQPPSPGPLTATVEQRAAGYAAEIIERTNAFYTLIHAVLENGVPENGPKSPAVSGQQLRAAFSPDQLQCIQAMLAALEPPAQAPSVPGR